MDNTNMSYDAPEEKVEVHHQDKNPTEQVTSYMNDQVPVSPRPVAMNTEPSPKGSKKKWVIISIVILILLLLGGGAYAYFFTNLKYKIPWLRPDTSELVNMMYQSFADIEGMDFSVSYEINVGDRDPDAVAPESMMSRYEEKRTGSYVRSAIGSVYYAVDTCHAAGENLQYKAGQNCDGSESSIPVAGEPVCEGSSTKWRDLDNYEGWEYGVCDSNYSDKTWSVMAKTDFNDDRVECGDGNYCTYLAEDELEGVESDEMLEFLSGGWWQEAFYEMENSIPNDLSANLTVTGKGFANPEEDKLPNFELGVEGMGKFGSLSMLLDLEARVVDEYIYYRVDEFPFLDITEGHMGEWIQTDENNDMWGEFVPEAEEANRELDQKFSDFIADTAKYDILEFISNGEEMEINDIPALMFDVNVKAENIPDWLEEINRIARESDDGSEMASDLLEMTKEKFTEEEKEKLVEVIDKVLENLKFSAALNPINGHLMYIGARARLIPPSDSKKFSDKQFNFIVGMKMWNQNNPSKIEKPEEYVSQDEIEREELGLSEEEYGDYKQSQRIINIRQKLDKYYIENKEFPSELSKVSRLTDYNTGNPYSYEAKDGNYYLTYSMNTSPSEDDVTGDPWGYNYGSKRRPAMNLGTNYNMGGYYVWRQGDNVADRYTPISDQYGNNVLSGDYTEHDGIVAVNQANLVYNTKERLWSYYNKYKKYPDSIEALAEEYKPSYYSYGYLPTAYLCEDLSMGDYCTYKAADDKQSFELKVNFGMSSSELGSTLQSKNKLSIFDKGENTFLGENGKREFVKELGLILNPSAYRWVKGSGNADITIVTYSDFDCPYCGRFHDTLNEVLANYPDDVNIAFKHFSLHPDSKKKALAAECVGKIGGNDKFWQFHDILFEEKPSVNQLTSEAVALGVDTIEFDTCFNGEQYMTKVDSDIKDAQEAGARGTPHSVIISGDTEVAVPGALPYSSLAAQIDEILIDTTVGDWGDDPWGTNSLYQLK